MSSERRLEPAALAESAGWRTVVLLQFALTFGNSIVATENTAQTSLPQNRRLSRAAQTGRRAPRSWRHARPPAHTW